MSQTDRLSRIAGAVLGAAIDDAMGHATEFLSSQGNREPVRSWRLNRLRTLVGKRWSEVRSLQRRYTDGGNCPQVPTSQSSSWVCSRVPDGEHSHRVR